MTRHLFLPVDNSILLKFRANRGDVPPIPPYIFWGRWQKEPSKTRPATYTYRDPPPIPTENDFHPPPIPPYQNWPVDNFTGRLFVSVRSQLSPPGRMMKKDARHTQYPGLSPSRPTPPFCLSASGFSASPIPSQSNRRHP